MSADEEFPSALFIDAAASRDTLHSTDWKYRDDTIPSTQKDPNLKHFIEAGPLAPDGLPWPEGYFDRIPPKQTIEEATKQFGVRPNRYAHGRPCYSTKETSLPQYKGVIPKESPETEELYRKWAAMDDAELHVLGTLIVKWHH